MNVEIGAEATLFPEKEYINGISVAVYWFLNFPPYVYFSMVRIKKHWFNAFCFFFKKENKKEFIFLFLERRIEIISPWLFICCSNKNYF
jgi:hypothetical protein